MILHAEILAREYRTFLEKKICRHILSYLKCCRRTFSYDSRFSMVPLHFPGVSHPMMLQFFLMNEHLNQDIFKTHPMTYVHADAKIVSYFMCLCAFMKYQKYDFFAFAIAVAVSTCLYFHDQPPKKHVNEKKSVCSIAIIKS